MKLTIYSHENDQIDSEFSDAHDVLLLISVVRDFQEYTEPDKAEVQPRRSGMSTSISEDDNVLLPLGETTLTHNLGLPIVLVVTKVCKITVHITCVRNALYSDESLPVFPGNPVFSVN